MDTTSGSTAWQWGWRQRRCGRPLRRCRVAALTGLAVAALVAAATAPPFFAEAIPLSAHTAASRPPTSTFQFTTVGNPTAGQAAAVATAGSLLSRLWSSAVPVAVRVAFRPLDEAATLAHTVNGRSLSVGGVPYPLAAAAALTGRSVCAAASAADVATGGDGAVARGSDGCPYDVDMVINSRQRWYAPDPRDASPSRLDRNEYDLVSVLLHEALHAMLLSGKIVHVERLSQTGRQGGGAAAVAVNGSWEDGGTADGAGSDGGGGGGSTPRVNPLPAGGRAFFHGGTPGRFDAFLSDARGCALSSYLTDRALQAATGLDGPALLAAALTHNSLYFAAAAADGSPSPPLVRLNGQRAYSSRASVYHLDEATYGSALMTPLMPRGRAVRALSPAVTRIRALVLDAAVPGAAICNAMTDPRSPSPGPPDLSWAHSGGGGGVGGAGGAGDAAATAGGEGGGGGSGTLLGMPLPVGVGVLVGAAAVLAVGAVLAARGGVVASRRSRRRSRRRASRRASRRGGVAGGRVHKRRSERRGGAAGGGRSGGGGGGRGSARPASARSSVRGPRGV